MSSRYTMYVGGGNRVIAQMWGAGYYRSVDVALKQTVYKNT
jgi:hypothetical protein